MTEELLRTRIKRLEHLANTADDTDEYCRLLAKLQESREELRKVAYIGTVVATRRCPMCGGVDCQRPHD